jgi:hypothetical protein
MTLWDHNSAFDPYEATQTSTSDDQAGAAEAGREGVVMMKHLTKRFGLTVAVLGLMVGAAGQVEASQVIGSDSGVFVNPNPNGSPIVTGGVGTSTFTWGQAGFGTGPNELKYTASNPINGLTETPFTLGKLTYFNGTTSVGTTPNTVDMKITLNLTQPGVVTKDFTFTLSLESTPNTGSADDNADFVFFPSIFSSETFTAGAQTYTLKLTGFGGVTGDGFLVSSSSELHVREGGTATANLMGVVTTNLSPVPEPSTIIAACTAVPMVLLVARRRRQAKVAS